MWKKYTFQGHVVTFDVDLRRAFAADISVSEKIEDAIRFMHKYDVKKMTLDGSEIERI